MPLFERRDFEFDLVAALAVLDMNWLAGSHPPLHLVEPVSISAQPANQEAVGDGVAFVEVVALPASVKGRMHGAIVGAREQS